MATFGSTIRDLFMNFIVILVNILYLPISLWTCINALIFTQRVIKPNVVAITGANAGIGEALSHTYAKDKCSLVLIARNIERLKKVAEECEKLGAPNVKIVQMDISDTKAVASFFDEKTIEYNIDLFIANAGVAHIPHLSFIDQADEVFKINVLGTIAGLNSVYKAYCKRGTGGQIACVSSIFGFTNPPCLLSYGASKSAIMSYSRDLRTMGKEFGISVNTIAPGFIRTAMIADLPLDKSYSLTPEYFAEQVKYGLAHDIPLISLPLSQYYLFGLASCMVPAARQFVADLLHKVVDKELETTKDAETVKLDKSK